jgi:hypothetical protein
LQEISDDFVERQIFNYFQKNPATLSKFKVNVRSTAYKKVIKDIRSQLRRIYGVFRIEEESSKRNDFVDELISHNRIYSLLIEKILNTHSSTKERLPFYQEFYKKLFKITGNPHKIVDLGCGINPFSTPFMELKEMKYFAYDISEDEINILNKFFSWMHKLNIGFLGKASIMNLENFSKVPKCDLVLLLKMTDVLDRGKGHKTTETVLKRIPAKHVVLSFPTLTMSGKRMNHPRRKWIELLCHRLKYTFKTISSDNEIFYVIKK